MKKYARAIILLVIGISATGFAFAQAGTTSTLAADKYLISAVAGGVNFTEGSVSVIRVDGKGGLLMKGDQIEIGDRISTGSDGRVEVLLNPGSYLRLGSNSAFEFKSTSLDDLQIKLASGSAIFEVFATDKFRVNVSTPKEKLAMFESGVYRIDLYTNGSGTISVTDGKAVVGPISNLILVTTGKMASFGAGGVVITKFDTGQRDALAQWSKTRAKDLAKMTASLNNANMRNSLNSSFNSGRWNVYDSFGLWIFDQRRGMYCFLPFGYGWYSPYGYGYATNIAPVYPRLYLPKDTTKSATPIESGSRYPKGDRPPPFTAIEKQQERRSVWGGDGGSGSRGDDKRYNSPPIERNGAADSPRTSSPSYSSPSSTVQLPVSVPAKPGKPIDY